MSNIVLIIFISYFKLIYEFYFLLILALVILVVYFVLFLFQVFIFFFWLTLITVKEERKISNLQSLVISFTFLLFNVRVTQSMMIRVFFFLIYTIIRSSLHFVGKSIIYSHGI